ncbi:hypothetical protein BGP75_24225 [Motiliproteus sp. MSK22-1]|nr:hypothetical protein BGP75_24225 [Motiliproteus sp. MSK22-1]
MIGKKVVENSTVRVFQLDSSRMVNDKNVVNKPRVTINEGRGKLTIKKPAAIQMFLTIFFFSR